MQPHVSDHRYPTTVEQREYHSGSADPVNGKDNRETDQPRLVSEEESLLVTSMQVSGGDKAKVEQAYPGASLERIPTEEENDKVSSKYVKTLFHSLSSPGRGEGIISDSQDGQSLDLPDKTSVVQRRRSLQRENHNAHTQRCREKINQMFQRLNEALPPRADGSHPRKKAEILTRALEIVKELQVENMSLKNTIQEMSRIQQGQFSSQTANVSFPVLDHLPLQKFSGEFADGRTNFIPLNGDINVQQQHQQFGNCTMLHVPPVSLPFLPLNSVAFQESQDRLFAVPPASKTPKLPPIIPNVNVGRIGVSQIESGPPKSLPELNGSHQDDAKPSWFPGMDNFLGDGSYTPGSTCVPLLSNVAVPTVRNLDSVAFQEFEQDSAGVVPQTTDVTGGAVFLRKETEHKDI
ncbi:hypothetical protein Gasu2_22280 [Galdieria sulphuraria]|uniref:BHLH domain-containing protein n=1 Tax=Galdieria sulphuraria TaxID=130081 RepID=M2XR21_GALSU|nr:uncharacterized protein Gasu_00690 [Galdieria sulphuraria]EME32702.1 hypothetical protein Gasu_00690 [Galdieria sulphuraria]GJD07903.1 hypothetical protein Gasu2_22280 [Galdieria sulphuraria]|eukprot:XP_005709222.1 hypothetical protein Gasu_00690 [Galdieria sulphuraria]